MKHNVLKNYGTYILLKDNYSQLMYIYEFLIGWLLKNAMKMSDMIPENLSVVVPLEQEEIFLLQKPLS